MDGGRTLVGIWRVDVGQETGYGTTSWPVEGGGCIDVLLRYYVSCMIS